MSSTDESYKKLEEWKKTLVEEFNTRLELIEDDELKNLLLILRDLFSISVALSTVWASSSADKSLILLKMINELKDELRKSKDFRDRYL